MAIAAFSILVLEIIFYLFDLSEMLLISMLGKYVTLMLLLLDRFSQFWMIFGEPIKSINHREGNFSISLAIFRGFCTSFCKTPRIASTQTPDSRGWVILLPVFVQSYTSLLCGTEVLKKHFKNEFRTAVSQKNHQYPLKFQKKCAMKLIHVGRASPEPVPGKRSYSWLNEDAVAVFNSCSSPWSKTSQCCWQSWISLGKNTF